MEILKIILLCVEVEASDFEVKDKAFENFVLSDR